MSILITQPSREDAAALRDLLLELGYRLTIEEVAQKITLFLSRDAYTIWVAKADDTVVGFCALHIIEPFYENKPYARIDSLVVHEGYRGYGVGKKLVQRAEEYAKQFHCKKIFLSSNNKRVEAHLFYEKMGYISDSRYFSKIIE